MPIGQCEYCGHEIVAPRDVLVWVDEHSYHQRCYQELVEQQISSEVNV